MSAGVDIRFPDMTHIVLLGICPMTPINGNSGSTRDIICESVLWQKSRNSNTEVHLHTHEYSFAYDTK